MPDMKTLRRICVGYGSVKISPCVDVYALYQPETQRIQYYKVDEIREMYNMLTVENLSNPCRMT